jgi:hypothetical protein
VQTRNTRRLIIWISFVATCLIGTGILFNAWISQSQKRQAELSELALFVAQEAINAQLELAQRGYTSPDNALAVHLEPEVLSTFYLPNLNSYRILSAWVYDENTLSHINRQEVEKISQNKDIFVYVIAIRTLEKNEAIVDVLTIYPWDETFSSHGGNESYWRLAACRRTKLIR